MTFLGKLAYQLNFNDQIEEEYVLRKREESVASVVVPEINASSHHIKTHVSLIFNFRSTIWLHYPLCPLVHRKQTDAFVAVDTKDVARMPHVTVLVAPILSRKLLFPIADPPQQADLALHSI